MHTKYLFKIQEASQVGAARRAATIFAQDLGLNESDVGRVALIVTELATNLVKHTANQGGELLLQEVSGRCGVEVLSLDQGPGIDNIARAMQDGYSTSGTQGEGLGGVKRTASVFDLFSASGLGTAVLAQVVSESPSGVVAPATDLQVGGVCLPVHGEELTGDLWSYRGKGRDLTLLVSDGLGHGPRANEASQEAIRVFDSAENSDLAGVFQSMQGALRKTRGAAVSIMHISLSTQKIRFMGIGNVSGAVVDRANVSHMVSLGGIVGHEVRKLQEFNYAFPPGALVVLHSDGIIGRWDLDRYPGLSVRHPSLIAGVLYRDFKRGRDDATIIVARARAA